MPGHVSARWRRPTTTASVVALLWCVIVAVPAGVAAHPLAASPSVPPSAPLSEEAIAAFPARAGYAPSDSALVHGSVLASGPMAVDVVFSPREGSNAPAGSGSVVPVGTFAQAEGLTPSQYASAARYFASYGIEMRHLWPDRLVLSLEGRASALDAAFHTIVRIGTYQGRSVAYPAAPPSLPSGLESEVAGVVGLSTGFQPFSISLSPTRPAGGDDASGPALLGNDTITPDDARSYYNVTLGSTYPTSEGIALLLWGAGYDPDDIQSFYANDFPSGMPEPTVTPYPIDGAPAPSPAALEAHDRQAVQELTLDIEWAGSMAPGANLSVIYPPGPSAANLTDAFEKALSLPGVVAISMSFGAPESTDSSLAASWAPLFNEAATRRITVLAASGDYGGDANVSCGGGPAPSFPASAPQVIAVGGTDLAPVRNTFGTIVGWNETGWSGSGGGYSALYSAPSWQKVGSAGTQINASGGGRGLPDVSATAVDDFIYFEGQNQQADGTSFATPLWAGVVADLDAEIGSPLGFFSDRLYHVASQETPSATYNGLRWINDGQNCVANAGASTGWNAVTGWGSPQAELLYYELVGSFVGLTISESPTTLPPGGTVTVQTEVTNWTNGAGVAGVPVTFSVESDTSVGPCTGVFDSVGAVSDLSGAAQAQLTVPFCYLGSHAILEVRVSTAKLYGMNESHVPVNLLGFLPSLGWFGQPPGSYVLFVGIIGASIAVGGWIGRRKGPLPSALPPSKPPSGPAAGPPSPPGPSGGPPPTPAGRPPPAAPTSPSPAGPVSPKS